MHAFTQALLPCSYPVTETTLNYAPVAVGIVLIWALGSFFCPGIGARHWYRGEKHTIEDFTVRAQSLCMLEASWIPRP